MSFNRSGDRAKRAVFVFAALLVANLAGVAHGQTPAAAPPPAGPAPTLDQLFGQDAPPPIIQNIGVRGNQRIESETVASYLQLQPGMPAEPELLDLSLKTLFNTGLFANVELAMQPNGTLLIEVAENPIVNRVILEGNRRVKDDKITEEIQLAPRAIYTRSKVQADTQKIVELYRAKGRFAARVVPKVTTLEQNRIDVIFEIDEGPKSGIAKVNFAGNEVFTDSQLRGEILTKESHWWNFFSSNDNYDPDRLEYERELLRQHYGRNGYADFTVLSAVAELTPDREDFFVTFTVEEGPRYTVGEVSVKTTLAKLDEDVLARFVPVKPGETFNSEKLEDAVEAITFATGSTGYAFVDVNPRLDRVPETNTINVTFEVNEGPRVYVERINIKGNTRTLDHVIRREVRLAEGDPFSRVLVDRSKARVRGLGFFSEVEIEEKPGSAPDRTELDVSVEEQSTGSFSVGVGVSSTENFIFDVSIAERNLMGRGQSLRFRVQASSRTRNVDIQFTQPYFLNRNLVAGVSAFNQRTNFRESGFVRDRIGFGLNTGFQVSEYGRGGINYLFTTDDVIIDTLSAVTLPAGDDPLSVLIPGATPNAVSAPFVDPISGNSFVSVSATLCDFILNSLSPTCQSRGSFLTSLVGLSASWDTRDDPLKPSRGWRAGLSVAVAGLGGDVNYYQAQMTGAKYVPLFGGLVGALKGRAGYIDGYAGDDVRLSDRFFEGAASFRGFEVAGVGPRFLSSFTRSGEPQGQAIGAKAFAIGSVELSVPLPLPEEYGIRASLFSDFGSVGLVDANTKAINNDPAFAFEVPLRDEDGAIVLDGSGNPVIDRVLAPVQDEFALRVSAGVTVSWDSPFGPVRFDLARVLKKEVYDQTEGFRFSAGTNF